MRKINKFLLNALACVITFLTVTTVNSACISVLGQDKEPESLKRFKKY